MLLVTQMETLHYILLPKMVTQILYRISWTDLTKTQVWLSTVKIKVVLHLCIMHQKMGIFAKSITQYVSERPPNGIYMLSPGNVPFSLHKISNPRFPYSSNFKAQKVGEGHTSLIFCTHKMPPKTVLFLSDFKLWLNMIKLPISCANLNN